MSLPELIPSNLPVFVRLTPRSNFANSVVPDGASLLLAESDGNGGSQLVKKNPDGTFEVVGGSITFYKCASVSSTTWQGALASVDPVTGEWSFAETTVERPIGRITPVVGSVYDAHCSFEVKNYNTGIPTQGLIFHAPLNGNTDTETGQTLTEYNTVTMTTYEGISCCYLPNNGSCLTCSADNFPTGNADITFSGWGNIPQGASMSIDWCMMCYGGYGSASYTASMRIKRTDYISAFQATIEDAGTIAPGWHHFAATRNASTLAVKFYVDGVLVGTATTSSSSIEGSYPFVIGNDYRYNGGFSDEAQWHGYVTAIRIYNRVLDAGEIASLASELSPTPAS